MTYSSNEIDTLYVGEFNFHSKSWNAVNIFFKAIPEEDRDSIRHLAIDSAINDYWNDDNDPEQEDLLGLWYLDYVTEVCPGGNYDIVFCESRSQRGEIHAWSRSPAGRIMPWYLREDEEVEEWEADLSSVWFNLENNMEAMQDHSLLGAYRCVSRKRLLKDSRWRKRQLFLEEVVQVLDCVYTKDGIIDRIMDWKANAPLKYGELVALLRRMVGDAYGPEELYIAETPCSCPFGHTALNIPRDLELREKVKHIDFRAAVNRVERLWAFEGLESGVASST